MTKGKNHLCVEKVVSAMGCINRSSEIQHTRKPFGPWQVKIKYNLERGWRCLDRPVNVERTCSAESNRMTLCSLSACLANTETKTLSRVW